MMFWYDHDLSAWGYVVMTITMVAFWGLLIGGVVMLIRLVSDSSPDDRGTGPNRSTSAAEQLLAERFARGEIDEEEYHRRLDVLHARDSLTRSS